MRRLPALLVAAAALASGAASHPARADEGVAPSATASPTPTPTSTSTPTPTATSTATATATATEASTSTPISTEAVPHPAPSGTGLRRELPMFGLSIGGGFPDFANANLLFRPVPWARLYAGPCWGYVSWGMQGGVVLAPWNGVATPTLSFQAGTLFSTDLRRFLKSDSKSANEVKPLLANVDYRYLAADLGLELGSPRGFNFFLRLGLSFVVIKANGSATHTADDGTRVTLRDPSVSAWMPSLKLGFQYWL